MLWNWHLELHLWEILIPPQGWSITGLVLVASSWLIVGRVIGVVGTGCRQGHLWGRWTVGCSDSRSGDGNCLQELSQNQKTEKNMLVVHKRLRGFLPLKGQFIEYFLSTWIKQSSTSGRQQDWAGVGNRQKAGRQGRSKDSRTRQSTGQAPLVTRMSKQPASWNKGKETGMLLLLTGLHSVRANH